MYEKEHTFLTSFRTLYCNPYSKCRKTHYRIL